MPNNSKLYWVCKNCKAKKKPAKSFSFAIPTTCSSNTGSTTGNAPVQPSVSIISVTTNPIVVANSANIINDNVSTLHSPCFSDENSIADQYESDKDKDFDMTFETPASFGNLDENESDKNSTAAEYESDEDLEIEFSHTGITCVTEGVTNRTASFGDLDENDYDIIISPDGWLDCKIIHAAHICLKKVNPNIEGFQRTTLGRVRNFDVMTSDFAQILHTGNSHWVCISSIGCSSGIVNLYDSLYNDIIDDEVEQQVKDLLPDNFVGIDVVPVQ
jgi:hypothetical protein